MGFCARRGNQPDIITKEDRVKKTSFFKTRQNQAEFGLNPYSGNETSADQGSIVPQCADGDVRERYELGVLLKRINCSLNQ